MLIEKSNTIPSYRHLLAMLLLLCFIFAGGLAEPLDVPYATTMPTTQPEGVTYANSEGSKMTMVQAIAIGVVEGITEYLPVSSTGHIILTQRTMGVPYETAAQKEAADAYAVVIQVGAILAVLGIYFGRIKGMLLGLLGKDADGFKLAVNVVVAFMPAAVVGLIFNDMIETYLFGLWPITAAWLVGGFAILLVAWWRKRNGVNAKEPEEGSEEASGEHAGKQLCDLSWQMALLIGFIQCLAMCPGTSRSLVTIVGGLLLGLRVSAAVEFSFLLGLVTLTAATAYKSVDAGPVMLENYSILTMVVGIIVAGISAFLAVKWMVAYLEKHSLAIFGWYRIGLAVVIGILLVTQVLQ